MSIKAGASFSSRSLIDPEPLKSVPEAFEVEDPCAEKAAIVRTCLGIFPLRLCCCCPATVLSIIPRSFQIIQDFTHLILFFGIIASIALCGDTIHSLILSQTCKTTGCAREILSIVFTLPCTFYFIRVIGQYDDRLQAKQNAAKEQRAKLTKELLGTINDMDDLLSRSAESSAGLAEQGFESKRRDFMRFLERVKAKYEKLPAGKSDVTDELLRQFQQFVFNWLKVFEECSIDPVHAPRLVVKFEELQACESVDTVCDLALKRLELAEIRFISKQREEDAEIMEKKRMNCQQALAIEDDQPMPSRVTTPVPAAAPRQKPMEAVIAHQSNWMQPSWAYVDSTCDCRYQAAEYSEIDGYFPRLFKCCCCTCSLLSREHLMLLCAFLAAWGILALELSMRTKEGKEDDAAARNLNITVVAETGLNVFCILVLLLRFEDIDVIQQLEREVRILKKNADEVQEQHEKMNDFWGNAMELTELWLYRTVPRLDVYKEVHQHIEDFSNPAQLCNYMANANASLQDLEQNLGDLGDWRQKGNFSIEDKKKFMNAMNGVTRTKDPQQQMDALSKSVENKKALDSWSGEGGGKNKLGIADKPKTGGGSFTANPAKGMMNMFGKKEEPSKSFNQGDKGNRPRVSSDPREGKVVDERPSLVEGFLTSNANAFGQMDAFNKKNSHKW